MGLATLLASWYVCIRCVYKSVYSNKISPIHKRCGRIISGAQLDTRYSVIFDELCRIPLPTQFSMNRGIMMYKVLNNMSPFYIKSNFKRVYESIHNTHILSWKCILSMSHCILLYIFTVRRTVSSWNILTTK